jgi:hypothetical protein
MDERERAPADMSIGSRKFETPGDYDLYLRQEELRSTQRFRLYLLALVPTSLVMVGMFWYLQTARANQLEERRLDMEYRRFQLELETKKSLAGANAPRAASCVDRPQQLRKIDGNWVPGSSCSEPSRSQPVFLASALQVWTTSVGPTATILCFCSVDEAEVRRQQEGPTGPPGSDGR